MRWIQSFSVAVQNNEKDNMDWKLPEGDHIGWVIALIAIVVALYGIWDVRRAKSRLERLAEVNRLAVGEARSFLIGIKPAVPTSVQTQINDHLEGIKKRLAEAEAISSRR